MVLFDESVLCYVNCQITDLYNKWAEKIHCWNKGDQVRPALGLQVMGITYDLDISMQE